MADSEIELLARAYKILSANDRGGHIVPSTQLYPHQWLWDSCFIAIGLAHWQSDRAAKEIEGLFKSQWQNGMLPHISFTEYSDYLWGPSFWKSWRSAEAPTNLQTSGMTQPPVVAIAALSVADRLMKNRGQAFLRGIYPGLLAYHQWIYRERDPQNRGLAVLVHPWESGLDNSPPWIELLKQNLNPLWMLTFIQLNLARVIYHLRGQNKIVPKHQRVDSAEAVKLIYRALRFRKRRYDSHNHLSKSHYLVEDVVFNSILIAANRALFDIATIIGKSLPKDLLNRMNLTERALEELWDEPTGQYFSRIYRGKKLLKVPSIGAFMPLFAGTISNVRAARLVELLKNRAKFWAAYPVPSAPLDSAYFDQHHYWQGPTWLSTNWLIIKGLLNYGFEIEAKQLLKASLDLIGQSGFREYFSPLSGEGFGIDNFSWSAALYLDLLNLKIDLEAKTKNR